MSKLICDVCGTSYPETATQCPICGCVRPGDVLTVTGDTDDSRENSERTYTYVKGGRFSKANVKKRNRGQEVPVKEVKKNDEEIERKTDKILVGIVIVLALAIVCVVAYIGLQLMGPGGIGGTKDTQSTTTEPVVTTTAEPTETTEADVPCSEIILSKTEIVFEKSGQMLALRIDIEPSNTTDPIFFASSDEAVATVGADGTVTAVDGGEAVITVTCGDATAECKVVCDFEGTAETTEPSETTAKTDENFELNRKENFTLFTKGETHDLYSGNIPDDQITWSSGNEKVATVKNGVVTAVGAGDTTIYAEYNGTKLSCGVICRDSVGAYTGPVEEEQSSGTDTRKYTISHEDVTISIDEKFNLTLKDSAGNVLNVTWIVDETSICFVNGNVVTGRAGGTAVVSCIYEDETYTCTVRVKGA